MPKKKFFMPFLDMDTVNIFRLTLNGIKHTLSKKVPPRASKMYMQKHREMNIIVWDEKRLSEILLNKFSPSGREALGSHT